MPGSELEDVLTAKGPGNIPAWGYGVGLAGVFMVVMYLRGKGSSSATPAPQTGPPGTTTETSTYSGPVYTWPFIGGPQPGAPSSNTEWEHQAADWLEAKGFSSGRVADALDDYLSGAPQDRENRRMVDLAVDMFGSPPQGAPPVWGSANWTLTHDSPPTDVADTGATGADTGVTGPGNATSDAPVTASPKDKDRRERRRRERRR